MKKLVPKSFGTSSSFVRIATAGFLVIPSSLTASKGSKIWCCPLRPHQRFGSSVLRMSGGQEGTNLTLADDGKVRKKMDVGEGRSMLHWQRLKVPIVRKNKITMEEVAKHNKDGDSWTVFFGKVYDTTAFYDYHPGGRSYIKMVAGKDGTAMFQKYHAYVNLDFMMSKCLIGPLVQPGEDTPASLSEDQELDDDEDEFDKEARRNAELNAATSKQSAMDEMD